MKARLPHALRIEHALRRHLGVFIDIELMLRSAPYARDVLYVCDTLANTELPELARAFRAAGAEAAWAALRAAARAATDVPCVDGAEPETTVATVPALAARTNPWLAPARWFC